jgi:phage gpG-like protein
MKFRIKTNFKEIMKGLENKDRKAMIAVENGMVRGMRLFESKIIAEQMTGRPGLKVQTGNLRRSWVVGVERDIGSTVVTLGTATKYARAHQFGTIIKHPGSSNGFGKGIKIPAHEVKMPKRLHILEDFKASGLQILSKQVSRELFTAYKTK